MTPSRKDIGKAILVAALGYFVDIYDLILFSIVRVGSLGNLGVPPAELLDTGVLLLNCQMGGMLLGGVLWGVLGDKKGRLTVLYGSILLYSVANVLNGLVTNVPTYAALRFIAGIGLAGELGAGITLVAELMDAKNRGWGTTVIATVGLMGAVVAALVGDYFPWRTAYFIGGGLGLGLLLLRIRVRESGLFEATKSGDIPRGRFTMLLWPPRRLLRYLRVIALGLPIWFAVGVLVTFSPEFGRTLGMAQIPSAGTAVLYTYVGLSLGDLASGLLSQLLRSRRRIVGLFILATMAAVGLYFGTAPVSLPAFYGICLFLGFATGYWAVFVTVASEQFGTNLRSTVTTSAPNFVRGAVVPITASFLALRTPLGMTGAALVVGGVTCLLALWALYYLEETYAKNLDYHEPI